MGEHFSSAVLTASTDMSESITIRVGKAVAGLLVQHELVSFYSVAERSAVSRSTLYRRDDLRRLVCAAREGANGVAGTRSRDAASEIARLELENARLRAALAATQAELGNAADERRAQYPQRAQRRQGHDLLRLRLPRQQRCGISLTLIAA
ncbi:MAG: hypothetical protein ACI38Z_02140 [Parafannyhessea sp.]|uniref:hypothetical protein n=1 Tax=Parafannyhessea sp. TaxID=2847324 RepID=UPI003EFD714B